MAFKPPGVGPVGSFGKPLQGYEMKILDDEDNECPPGVQGEICCRPAQGSTASVEVEYLGNPEASKKKIRSGWNRSGDVGHRDAEGWLYFDYRKGGGIRHNGDFINPGFVEKVIAESAQVDDVFVYGVPALSGAPGEKDVVGIVRRGIEAAAKARARTVVVDTAGRLQIDAELMDELRRLKEAVRPHEILLVADGMTGQDAVRIASGFHEALGVTGVILTKMDGDARGGAALSIREVTKVPIKWIGVGEKLDRLEEFRPEGMASRIIGQGDLMSMIEKVQRAIVDNFERQQSAFVTSGLMLDDGVIDPRDTRNVLGLVLSISREADARTLRPVQFAVARP